MYEPHVEVLAEKLTACLNQAQSAEVVVRVPPNPPLLLIFASFALFGVCRPVLAAGSLASVWFSASGGATSGSPHPPRIHSSAKKMKVEVCSCVFANRLRFSGSHQLLPVDRHLQRGVPSWRLRSWPLACPFSARFGWAAPAPGRWFARVALGALCAGLRRPPPAAARRAARGAASRRCGGSNRSRKLLEISRKVQRCGRWASSPRFLALEQRRQVYSRLLLEQRFDINTKRFGNADERGDCHIDIPGFNLLVMPGGNLHCIGSLFLRPASILAETPNITCGRLCV